MGTNIDLRQLIEHPPFQLTAVDKAVLTTAEEDFVPHSWEDLKQIIARGDTSLLRRTPTDLRNYMLWTRQIQATFGSATSFVLQNRLSWKSESQSGRATFPYCDATPFSAASDYRILRNDWPYAMSPGTTHLVVWSKTPIPVDGDGDPTPGSRQLIADFVDRTFAEQMSWRNHAGDNIQWFRNRTKWQSVRTLEHIHVLLRDVDEEFVTALTGQSPQDAQLRHRPLQRSQLPTVSSIGIFPDTLLLDSVLINATAAGDIAGIFLTKWKEEPACHPLTARSVSLPHPTGHERGSPFGPGESGANSFQIPWIVVECTL